MCLRYQPPNLAISTLYWKAWPLLLVVAAFNPENIGEPSAARRLLAARWWLLLWAFGLSGPGGSWEGGPGGLGAGGGQGGRCVWLPPAVSLPSGLAAWEDYPTLKMLMEMVMTKYARLPAADGP